MNSVLIVSSSDKGRDAVAGLLSPEAFTLTAHVRTGRQARELLINQEVDIVIINAPLSDEFGHDLSISIAEHSSAGILLLVRSDMADEVSVYVENYGVFVVPKPISRSLFYQALKLVETSHKRISGLKQQNVRLQSKIDDLKIINRAKCVLIEHLNMSETEAHRYIEKQAMDMRESKREIAYAILRTYEA